MSILRLTTERQPVLAEHSLDALARSRRALWHVGRVRLPLAGPYRPWATLYRFPDGRLLWCVRLWNVDHAEPRCVGTDILRRFARQNGLPKLLAEIDSLVERGLSRDAPSVA